MDIRILKAKIQSSYWNLIYRLSMPRIFAVITEVPNDLEGNHFDKFLKLTKVQTGWGYNGASDEFDYMYCEIPNTEILGDDYIRVKLQNFKIGEILLLSKSGREYGYPGRKPCKWNVSYETFYFPWSAIKRSRQVSQEHMNVLTANSKKG